MSTNRRNSWIDFVKIAGPSLADRVAVGDNAAAKKLEEERMAKAYREEHPRFVDGKRFLQSEGRKYLSRATPDQQKKFWEDAAKFQSDAMGWRSAAASMLMPGMGTLGGMALDGTAGTIQGIMGGKGFGESVASGAYGAARGAIGGRFSDKIVPAASTVLKKVPAVRRIATPVWDRLEDVSKYMLGGRISDSMDNNS